MAKFFNLPEKIPIAANLLTLKFDWNLAYKKLPATCAVSWDAEKVDKKISEATGGVVKHVTYSVIFHRYQLVFYIQFFFE